MIDVILLVTNIVGTHINPFSTLEERNNGETH